MNSIPRPILVAAAAIATVQSSSALLSTHDVIVLSQHNRPSFVTRLHAANNIRQEFSELDAMKAKRMALLRQRRGGGGAVPEFENLSRDILDADPSSDSSSSNDNDPLEYLYEDGEERHSDDLFHIILMSSTFTKPQMSLQYATESCTSILSIPPTKAHDLSLFAKHQGFSCLGTWTRGECLSFGEELSKNELDCRVVPFNEGSSVVQVREREEVLPEMEIRVEGINTPSLSANKIRVEGVPTPSSANKIRLEGSVPTLSANKIRVGGVPTSSANKISAMGV